MSLFYHRVADHAENDWTISCSKFQNQIDWLEQNFEIVDLEECQRRIRSGWNSRPTVSITFDDGYAENCDFALPLLIERRIPVTYFVTTYHTTQQQPFPHDVDRDMPLPTNTIESLRALDLAGVEIGAHTRTHVDLGKITCEQTLVDEVITASRELEAAIGRQISDGSSDPACAPLQRGGDVAKTRQPGLFSFRSAATEPPVADGRPSRPDAIGGFAHPCSEPAIAFRTSGPVADAGRPAKCPDGARHGPDPPTAAGAGQHPALRRD